MWEKIVLLHTQKATQNVHYFQEKFYNFQMQETNDLKTFMGEIEMFINHLKNFGEDCFWRAPNSLKNSNVIPK